MIPTTVAALQLQIEQVKALDNLSKSTRRHFSGVWMIFSSHDAIGLSQANRMHSDEFINQSTWLNIQSAQFYLLTQPEGLQKVLKIM